VRKCFLAVAGGATYDIRWQQKPHSYRERNKSAPARRICGTVDVGCRAGQSDAEPCFECTNVFEAITMRAAGTALRKLFGLFVDDGWLAVATLGVIAFTGAIRFVLPASPILAGTILVIGLVAVLAGSIVAGLRN
jgi:hypothetical protein